jgi:hypothetical protein
MYGKFLGKIFLKLLRNELVKRDYDTVILIKSMALERFVSLTPTADFRKPIKINENQQ